MCVHDHVAVVNLACTKGSKPPEVHVLWVKRTHHERERLTANVVYILLVEINKRER